MVKEDDDLFKPVSFKEKVLNHTPDILFVMLVVAVGLTIFNARKNGYIQNDNTQQTLKQSTETKQINSVLFNDSISQKVR